MPNLSVPISSLLSVLGSAQTKPEGAATGTDNFSALLNIGSEPASEKESAVLPLRRKASVQEDEPVAAHLDAPLQTSETPRRNNDTRREPRETDVEGRARPAPTEKTSEPKTAARKSDSANDNAPVSDDVAPVREASDSASPQEEAPQEASVRQQLDTIGQILQSILQALQPQAANAEVTTVDSAPVTNTPQLAANTAGLLLPVASDASPVVAAPVSDTTLLADLQTLADDLTQLISKTVDPTAVKTAEAPTTSQTLPALTDALQSSLKTLAQLLPQATQAPTANAQAPVADQAVESSPYLLSVKDKISAALAQVKSALPTDQKTVGDAPALSKPSFIVPVATSTSQDVTLAAPAAKEVSTKPEIAAAVSTVAQPVINPATLPGQAVAAPVQNAAITDSGADTSGQQSGSDSGSGKFSGQPSALSAPLTGQAQAADSAYKSDFAKALNQASKATVAEQVVFHIKNGAADGSSKISIQLDPVELGKLDIKLHVGADGKTGMVLTADNKSTLEMLQRDVQNLMRALNDAGLQTDAGSMSFNLRGGQQEAGQQGENFGRSQAAQTYQKTQPEEEAPAINAITRSYVVNLADGLDIKI